MPGQTLPPDWSPEIYADWLFRFLRADLSSLPAPQLHSMRVDTWRFVQPELIDDWKDNGLPTVETLEKLQVEANGGIRKIRKGDSWGLEKGISYEIVRFEDRLIIGSRRGNFDDLFRSAVMEILQRFWDRLRNCPQCSGLFLKIGKQKYCSQECASRAHWERFKSRHAGRDHQREYEQRIQKRLGPRVKIRHRRQQ
jgi:hypothetical protein